MGKPIKVLMVDDEERFRKTTEKILSRRGFDTILAESGEAAIEKLQENPDVVILDVKMPGMDGHQVLKEIKKRRPDIPVIMLTGHGAIPSARQALVQGAFDYLAKPCDIDILATKVTDAYGQGRMHRPAEERAVRDVMIPLSEYTTLTLDQTVRDAVESLQESFSCKVSTSRIMETGHRSVLVFDDLGKVRGILAITDLINAIMPAYLSAPKPFTADSIQYSPMFWTGMFHREVKALAKRKIGEIMSPAPLSIEAEANLMEAAYLMFSTKARRLAVVSGGEVVGVVREQDIFFEMAKMINELS